MVNKYFNYSEESALVRHQNGIKIINRDEVQNYPKNDLGISVGEVLKLPMNVYFLGLQSVIQNLNEICSQKVASLSPKECIGNNLLDLNVCPPDLAIDCLHNDEKVMNTHSVLLAEEYTGVYIVGRYEKYLTIKLPWYKDNNEIQGVFGLSTLFDDQAFTESLMQIIQLGFLSKPIQIMEEEYHHGCWVNNVYITKREREVLALLIRGKPARQIAALLNISQRTVDQHIINVKLKLNVKTKAELIEMIFDYFTNGIMSFNSIKTS